MNEQTGEKPSHAELEHENMLKRLEHESKAMLEFEMSFGEKVRGTVSQWVEGKGVHVRTEGGNTRLLSFEKIKDYEVVPEED
ncbi:MAG: hypothetical protein Q8Q20_05715 [bacterium]|nr:hypothetical protein [bacterium]